MDLKPHLVYTNLIADLEVVRLRLPLLSTEDLLQVRQALCVVYQETREIVADRSIAENRKVA